MRITKNFTLEEFLFSETATRHNIEEQNKPSPQVLKNIEILCVNLLQPLREILSDGYIKVTSGYRCERLNGLVKGSNTSQHTVGEAADIQYYENGKIENEKIIEAMRESGIEYDQMIDEFDLAWVHLSYRLGKNRMMSFKKV